MPYCPDRLLDPTIEDTLVHREGIAALLIALGELDERERDIVALKFSGALTNRQIARLVNLNSSNIGVILFRALHKMKSKLLIIEGQVCDE